MMSLRLIACSILLVAVLTSGAGHANGASDLLEARRSSTDTLLDVIASGESKDEVVRARLTLADRAVNQSIEDVAKHLAAADSLLMPETDAAHFALAIHCQLEHRQGLAAAEQSCGALASGASKTEDPLVQAYIHTTLSYYFYREGQHSRSHSEAESALTLSRSLGDHDLLAATNNMIGLHFSTQLRPRMSVTHFETSLEHARQMVAPEFKSLIQLNLASSYTYLGRAKEALDLLREVQATPVVDLYPTRRLVVASMIAQAKVAAGQLEGAEQELLATINDVKDSVLQDGMTFGYTSLGIVQLADRRPQEALVNFDRVLEISNQGFATGLQHPRVRLLVVPYAVALRELGRVDEAQSLLESIVATIPEDEPDQLLVDATRELATTMRVAGDGPAARAANEKSVRLETLLWDVNFRYRVARLNVSLELDRQKVELELAQAREATLLAKAEREAALRRQSWLVAAMIIVVLILLFSRQVQKRVAATERAANERLEGLVDLRTQELSDEMAQRLQVEIERRRLSEKLAEGEKIRAVGQLTAGVAHDFNNLMSIVSLTAENLKFSIADGDESLTREMIRDILSAADSGSKITDGLLAYVRKQPLRPEVLALDIFLEEALPIFRNTLGERIALSTRIEPCQVMVDKGQLTTSILNLILNAKDAMPDGGELLLDLHVHSDTAKILVRDTGFGMLEETRQHACEPFFTTKQTGEGTGLGLSMVYGFARQSGGDLLIESAVSKGTKVTLSLPLVHAESANAQVPCPQQESANRVVRVLVVEDRDFLLRMLQRTLQQMGMQVQIAGSADAALEIVDAEGLPDLVISDVMMPGDIDGPGLGAILRQHKADLPILLISGYSEIVDPAYGFLRKPFSMAELEQAIDEVMQVDGVTATNN